MNSNITNIKEARARRNPDTMINLAMNDPGHIARRAAKRKTYYEEKRARDEEVMFLRARLAQMDLILAKTVAVTAIIVVAAMLVGFLG